MTTTTDKKEWPNPAIGSFCIHTHKWGKNGCRVVAYDGDSIVIKRLDSGYAGVPANSLTVCTEAKARRVQMELIKGRRHDHAN